jgi:sarcosine oxidase
MYDAIVIGVGGMGSAALYHLASRGARVLGLEQFDIPHERGSSHGLTRIIRLAYWEHSSYVPLLRRAYSLWHDLERAADEPLLIVGGSIDAAPEGSRQMAGVLDACARYELPHERFTGRSLSARFPGYRLPHDVVAVYQPDGGFLLSERCIVAHTTLAGRAGAAIVTGERVLDWTEAASGFEVRTMGDRYRARRLVFTSGAWTGKLLPFLNGVLHVERQVMLWTAPVRPELFSVQTFPVFYIHVVEGSFYGFPVHGAPGFKIGRYHHRGQILDPDADPLPMDDQDERVLRAAIARYFPDADGATVTAKTCLFTNTSDEHFVIGQLRGSPAVCYAGGFSGHGYKFCSVVGEILADLALNEGTDKDISLFDPERLKRSGTA